MNYTWNLQLEKNIKVSPSWNSKCIFEAINRITRYWNVTFQQVTANPMFRIVITSRSPNPTWAAWTSGNTIYINHKYTFMNFAQSVFVLVHEMGHIFRSGNIHAADPRNVMFSSITDVYKNFHQQDPSWYNFSWKSAKRPWNEPNVWRPVVATSMLGPTLYDDGNFPCLVGHRNAWIDRVLDYFTSYRVETVEH